MNKFVSFKIKILLALLPLAVFFVLFCLAVIKGGEQIALNKSLVSRAQITAQSLALMSVDSLNDSSNQAKSEKLQKNIIQLFDQPGAVLFRVINSSGKVKACSDASQIGQILNDEQTKKALSSSIAYSDSSVFSKKECVLCSVPIRSGDKHMGTVMVFISKAEINNVTSALKKQLLGLSFILISCSIIFAALMVYWYGNPILNLAAAIDGLAQGRLETRADAARNDEIGMAAARVNKLADYIQKIIIESKSEITKTQERIRSLRVFIDNVLSGDTESQAQVINIDEIGQLAMGLNEVVRHMRTMRATEEALQYRINAAERASCPTLGDFSKAAAKHSPKADPISKKSSSLQYKNRVLPESETVIAVSSGKPSSKSKSAQDDPAFQQAAAKLSRPRPVIQNAPKQPAAQNQSIPNPQEAFARIQEMADAADGRLSSTEKLISIPDNLTLNGSELSNSQIAYINNISRLGNGSSVLIATGGTEDSYPFLKNILENEGCRVLHASSVSEMLNIAAQEDIQLIMVEFNEIEGGNQAAVTRLRRKPECADISVIVLEAALTDAPYASMNGIIQIVIPNTDDELINMIREALAEILLTGGSNPFI